MKPRLTLLPLAFVVSAAQAQLAETAGFSGEISINAGVISSESNFNTDNSKTTKALKATQPSSQRRSEVSPTRLVTSSTTKCMLVQRVPMWQSVHWLFN